jgi:fructose-1,6-bisphosphatase/inositol monophosphatase family enzyme
MKLARFRNLGTTALQMAYVAQGGLVATIVNTPKLWDLAAGVVIGESAGAVFTDWQGNPIFPINPADYQSERIPCLLANPKVQPKLIQMLNS